MALFALWPAYRALTPEIAYARLRAEAHIIPASATQALIGPWRLAAFATATRFYQPAEQCWHNPITGEACVLHGVVWRARDGHPRRLTARGVADLLDTPSSTLPEDVAGEYAILRVFADGQVLALSDPAGLHHLFHTEDGIATIANRAAFLAALRGDWRSDTRTLTWLPAIGYRVGEGTSYRGVRAVPQGAAVVLAPDRCDIRPLPRPMIAFPDRRGFAHGGEALLQAGILQAQAAVRLATDGQDRIDLPITGGKDSRSVLALCLSAGLGNRLRLFTRGYEGHPDVVAGRLIAEACALPHERQAPHGSDGPALWTLDMFAGAMAAQTFQTDGMVGGWDLILGRRTGTETLITGHMGEVLKVYAKRPLPNAPLGPVELVKLQAPFDPLGLLRPATTAELSAQIQAQMDQALGAGADRSDLPDVFYVRNRIPNWLGAIRGIKSFERQPIMPLGVPALMRLAFVMSAEERRMEMVHHRLVRDLAPQLLPLPFALQRWDPRMEPAGAAPILAAEGPVFGNWQYSLNHNAAIRTWLIEFFAARDLALWQALDRGAVIRHLRERTFSYFDGISILGLTIAALQEAGSVHPTYLASDDAAPCPPPHDRTTGQVGLADRARPTRVDRPAIHNLQGRLDAVTGPVANETEGVYRVLGAGEISFHGWLQAGDVPGARLAVDAVCGEKRLGTAIADQFRSDLLQAGIGDGRHGFALHLDSGIVAGTGAASIALTASDDGYVLAGGQVVLRASHKRIDGGDIGPADARDARAAGACDRVSEGGAG